LAPSRSWSCATSLSESGTWHAGTEWIWDNHYTMTQVLKSLERPGLVETFDHPQHAEAYRITELGRQRSGRAMAQSRPPAIDHPNPQATAQNRSKSQAVAADARHVSS
jgi:DNA-binding PadR family transcriptional regulator